MKLLIYTAENNLIPESTAQREGCCIVVYKCFLLRFFQASYLTTIMGRHAKKKNKNNAKPEKDPQEVQNDEATEQYVFHDKECQKVWHQTLRKLPPGQTINIPYLKQLDARVLVPIAYCQKEDIDQVTCSCISCQGHQASLGIV